MKPSKKLVRCATTEEISVAIEQLRYNAPWRTVLARMILWGLRPHEAFKGEVLANGAYRVAADTKTGTRVVYSPEVVDRPDLFQWAQGPLPRIKLEGVPNREIGHRVNRQFKNSGVPCNPYSLRHRFVINLELLSVPSNIAAKLEGHSERVRSESYFATFNEIHQERFARSAGWTIDDTNVTFTTTTNDQRIAAIA